MKNRQNSPKFKKAQGLITQDIGQEMLVYREASHEGFCLNPTAAEVWRMQDGVRTAEQIAAAIAAKLSMPVTEDLILLTLSELRGDGLLDEENSSANVFVAPSRRDVMRQLGFGAAAILPVIATVMTPKAAQAYTGCLNCNIRRNPPSLPQQH